MDETKEMSLKDRVSRLLSVKSLVTVMLTWVFAYLAIDKTVSGEQFMTVFTTIIAFYYGTQAKKQSGNMSRERNK